MRFTVSVFLLYWVEHLVCRVQSSHSLWFLVNVHSSKPMCALAFEAVWQFRVKGLGVRGFADSCEVVTYGQKLWILH